MLSFDKFICTKYPPRNESPPQQLWKNPAFMYHQEMPRLSDKEMYESMQHQFARLPPPGACKSDHDPAPGRCHTGKLNKD